MALEIKLNMKLTHRMVMTPMLQQAIKLLPLARLELVQKVRQELVENPMLEEVVSEENPDEEQEEEGFVATKDEEVPPTKENNDENPDIDWENFIQSNIDRGLSSDGLTERPSIESTLKSETSLGDHLLWQLIMASVDENEKAIGREIIGNINASGYLECSTDEIAESLKVSVENIEK
ncbi:MAG: RNA polymerase sigma-54 factor, partial [Nitrospinota bacterium]